MREPATTDAQLAAMRRHVREGTTDRPGIYRMLADDGEVVYVGKSKKLRTRLLSYFRCGPDDKGARILRTARSIEWEYAPSEFAALLLELRAIKRLRPRFNVAMKRDGRHYAFVKVTRGPAPKLLVVRGAGSDDTGTYYGPYHGAQRIGEAVRELNDALGLRDCSLTTRMHFADQRELFVLTPRTPGCIRHEIQKCLGPCIAGCRETEYDERVRHARNFLEGGDEAPLEALRARMIEASEQLAFERAGMLRDKLTRLEVLREQLSRLRFAVETLSFVYTVPGHDGDDRLYVVRRGRVCAERQPPRTRADHDELKQIVGDIFSPAVRESPAAIPAHEIDELLLLSSWFRRFPTELTRAEDATRFLDATVM